MIRVVSANVNGARAAVRRGGLAWLRAQQPDVLCLQEVRCTDGQLRELLHLEGFVGWHVAHDVAADKGRAGVAVVTPQPPLAVRHGVGRREFAGTGRWVEVDVATSVGVLTAVSAYVPTGEAGTERQELKYRFLEAATRRMAALRRAVVPDGAGVVVAGDLNVAHREADLRNWRGNLTRSGFLRPERAYLDRWLASSGGYVDVHRSLAGEGPGPYTWWSWRGKAFDSDSGWRIDYHLASRELATRAVKATVGRADSYAERWSDHAALTIDYDL